MLRVPRQKKLLVLTTTLLLFSVLIWGVLMPSTHWIPLWKHKSNHVTDEIRHVVFVKVHKSASTTLMNIFVRFAMSRELNVLFPRTGNILSEFSTSLHPIVRHPASPPFIFDILCNHVVFDKTVISPYFPQDTKYIAVLRHPWDQAQSAFNYYGDTLGYLRNVSSFSDLIWNSSYYEPKNPRNSFTHNRMSVDLGLPRTQISNSSHIPVFLQELDSNFDLVLITERFDESLVLLKRLLRWRTKDIVYVRLNKYRYKAKEKPNPKLKEKFEKNNQFDVAVYKHFSDILDQKVRAQSDLFQAEVKAFRDIVKQIREFCDGLVSQKPLVIASAKWNSEFSISRVDCRLIKTPERRLVRLARARQLSRTYRQYRDMALGRGRRMVPVHN